MFGKKLLSTFTVSAMIWAVAPIWGTITGPIQDCGPDWGTACATSASNDRTRPATRHPVPYALPVDILMDFDAMIEQAIQNFHAGKYKDAVTISSEAIKTLEGNNLDQGLGIAYFIRGLANAFSANDDLAFADYQTALNLNPGLTFIYAKRAYIFMRQHKYSDAEADIRRALEADPTDIETQHSLGDVYYYSGRPDAAVKHWRETCALADTVQIADWQKRLSEINRYDGKASGRCDQALIDAFAKCARERCQF